MGNPIGNPNWTEGKSGNPEGRPKGSRNRRTQDILDLLSNRGDKDPLDFLSEIVSGNGAYPPELKLTAANYLSPYLHSKRGMTVAPRFIGEPVQVPNFNSIEEAEMFLAQLSQRAGSGDLDMQSALDLSTLTRAWISACYEREELKLKLATAGHLVRDTVIQVTGGLPDLPGTDIIMPQINGVRGSTQDLPAATELARAQSPAQTIDHESQEHPAIEADYVTDTTTSPGAPAAPETASTGQNRPDARMDQEPISEPNPGPQVACPSSVLTGGLCPSPPTHPQSAETEPASFAPPGAVSFAVLETTPRPVSSAAPVTPVPGPTATDAPSPGDDCVARIDSGSPDFQETNPRSSALEPASVGLPSTDTNSVSTDTFQTTQDPQP
jgi:hypothetical protein